MLQKRFYQQNWAASRPILLRPSLQHFALLWGNSFGQILSSGMTSDSIAKTSKNYERARSSPPKLETQAPHVGGFVKFSEVFAMASLIISDDNTAWYGALIKQAYKRQQVQILKRSHLQCKRTSAVLPSDFQGVEKGQTSTCLALRAKATRNAN